MLRDMVRNGDYGDGSDAVGGGVMKYGDAQGCGGM